MNESDSGKNGELSLSGLVAKLFDGAYETYFQPLKSPLPPLIPFFCAWMGAMSFLVSGFTFCVVPRGWIAEGCGIGNSGTGIPSLTGMIILVAGSILFGGLIAPAKTKHGSARLFLSGLFMRARPDHQPLQLGRHGAHPRHTVGSTALKIAPRLARKFVSRTALQRMANRLAMNKPLIDTLKTARTVSDAADDARDFVRDASVRFVPTKRGLRNACEDLRDLGRAATADSANLIGEAEREYTSRTRTDAQRQAFSNLVNGYDRMKQDVEAIESLEAVYTGNQDPVDGVNNLPDNGGNGIRVGRSCESGYEEFPIDDETSTCVFASLVERNCYAGSRRVREPDLGGADACLYYQLDFFQPGGTCRENYDRVQYQGRETCRWAELGATRLAWYTLRKEQDEETGVAECVTARWSGVVGSCGPYGDDYGVAFTNSCSYVVSVRWASDEVSSWWGAASIRSGGTYTAIQYCEDRPPSSSQFKFCAYNDDIFPSPCYCDSISWRYLD